MEVAIARLLLVGLRALLRVIGGLDQFRAQHRHGLGHRARRLVLQTARPERRGEHRVRLDQRPVQRAGEGFHNHRLSADERAGTVSRVHRRDAEAPHPVHEWIVRIEGIDRAQLRLHRRGLLHLLLIVRLVQQARQSHHRVRINQPRRHHLGDEHAIVVRDFRRRGLADGLNLPVLHQHHAVAQRFARHGVNQLAANRQRFGCLRGPGQECQQDEQGNPCGSGRAGILPAQRAFQREPDRRLRRRGQARCLPYVAVRGEGKRHVRFSSVIHS